MAEQRQRILNIGCGLDKYAEKRLDVPLSRDDTVIGLDKHRLVGVDVVHDLNELPLPFADNEFDMIYAAHVMEHLNNTDELLIELHRILKPKGVMRIIVPHRTNLVAYSYHHKTYWSMLSFDYIQSSKTVSGLTGLFIPKKRIKLLWPFALLEPLVNRFPAFYEWRLSWLIPAVELHFELEAVKE